MYKIEYYQDPKGDRPVEVWIRSLYLKAQTNDKDARILFNAIDHSLKLLSEKGTRLGKPKVRCLCGGIYRLRPDGWRIFFGQQGDVFILLHYAIKKGQKTRKEDYETAARRMSDWLKRFGGG
jgi:phage-related protein